MNEFAPPLVLMLLLALVYASIWGGISLALLVSVGPVGVRLGVVFGLLICAAVLTSLDVGCTRIFGPYVPAPPRSP